MLNSGAPKRGEGNSVQALKMRFERSKCMPISEEKLSIVTCTA